MGERPLLLASSSPRRRALLAEAGLRFRVRAPDVDESRHPGELPEACARRLALAKARAIASLEPASCVLAADTLVVLGDEVLGKPADEEEAAAMLLRLAGRTHRVLTAFAVVVRESAHEEAEVVESRVVLGSVTPEEARAYAASGEPLDKAGAYALQGRGGRFVERVLGSRTNVIGLPLERVLPALGRAGVTEG